MTYTMRIGLYEHVLHQENNQQASCTQYSVGLLVQTYSPTVPARLVKHNSIRLYDPIRSGIKTS